MHWTTKSCLLSIGLGASLALCTLPLQAQDVHKAIIQTIQDNPDVLVAIKTWMASEQGIQAAKGEYFPKLSLNAKYGRTNMRTDPADETVENTQSATNSSGVGIALTQVLYNGFKTTHEVERNRYRTQADVYKAQGITDDIALVAIRAYLDVLRNQQLVKFAQQNYTAHKKISNLIHQRAETGLAREADTTQAQGRLALAQSNLIASKNRHHDAEIAYEKITGIMPQHLIIPKGPQPTDIPKTQKDAIEEALQSHPTLKSAKIDVKEARAQYKSALSLNCPKLNASINANHARTLNGESKGRTNSCSAEVRLSYNIFNGGSDFANQRKSAILVNKAEAVAYKTRRQVIESMSLSWNALKTTQAQLADLALHRDASIKTENSYRQQFLLGKRTLLDVLDAENELFTSQASYANMKFSLLLAKFRVLNSAGKLLPYMNIGLPKPLETFQWSV